MITIRNNTLERISTWTKDSIYVLADFDRTITSGNSTTSWGILEKSNYMPKEYSIERQKLYNYYGPLEIDETIAPNEKKIYMHEWWSKHLNLLVKHQVSEKLINESSKHNIMTLRPGAKTLLENLYKNNIPVIIISAGIGNFIETFLKNNNCYYDNIHIISNFIKFDNGIAVGIKSTLIHTQNKNEVTLSPIVKEYISNRSNIILFGDNTGDARMTTDKNTLRIGFLEEKINENKPFYEEAFDIVCINSDYNELLEILPILKDH